MNKISQITLEANKHFVLEGAQHTLSVSPLYPNSTTDHRWSLNSTSGTNYCHATFAECIERKNELMLFASTGY